MTYEAIGSQQLAAGYGPCEFWLSADSSLRLGEEGKRYEDQGDTDHRTDHGGRKEDADREHCQPDSDANQVETLSTPPGRLSDAACYLQPPYAPCNDQRIFDRPHMSGGRRSSPPEAEFTAVT